MHTNEEKKCNTIKHKQKRLILTKWIRTVYSSLVQDSRYTELHTWHGNKTACNALGCPYYMYWAELLNRGVLTSSNVVSRNGRQIVDEMAKHDREWDPRLRLSSETYLKIIPFLWWSFFQRNFTSNSSSVWVFFSLPCVTYDVLFESCLESSVCVWHWGSEALSKLPVL